jgi:hypothetical protein
MFFLLLNGKAISKHTTKELAEKKQLSESKKLNKGRHQSYKVTTSKDTLTIAETEKGSESFNKFVSHIDFAKEYKEKYNMLYKRKNPDDYEKFLVKMELFRNEQ